MENRQSPTQKDDRKKKFNNLSLYLSMFFLIAITASLCVVFFGDSLFPRKEREPRYIYKSPLPARTSKPMNTRREVSIEQSKLLDNSTQLKPNSEKQAETKEVATRRESEMSIPNVNVETSDSISEQDESVNRQKEEEQRQAWEKRKAEINETIEIGKEALEEASDMLDQVIPPLANHLNTLSIEEQRTFLKQMETMMYSQMPPESQDLFKEHPEYIDEGWKQILDKLAEHGYEAPEGIE